MSDPLEVEIRVGVWMYAGTIETAVRILQTQVAFGTGDYEDEPEDACDRPGVYFYVEWSEAGGTTGGSRVGPFNSLEDAEQYVRKTSYETITWRHLGGKSGPS